MTDSQPEQAPAPRKRFPYIVALVACALMGGGGFAFVSLDPLHVLPTEPTESEHEVAQPAIDIAHPSFIALDPLLISLGPNSRSEHLRFSATLDVMPGHEAEIRSVLPRIADMIATYLRAVDPTMLEQPAALLTLRAQMLRRVSVIVGPDRVHDLLITEFILN